MDIAEKAKHLVVDTESIIAKFGLDSFQISCSNMRIPTYSRRTLEINGWMMVYDVDTSGNMFPAAALHIIPLNVFHTFYKVIQYIEKDTGYNPGRVADQFVLSYYDMVVLKHKRADHCTVTDELLRYGTKEKKRRGKVLHSYGRINKV